MENASISHVLINETTNFTATTAMAKICLPKPPQWSRLAIFMASMIVCILGILGNGITVAIFSQRKFLSSINVLISGLALFDMLFIILFQIAIIPFGLVFYTGKNCDAVKYQVFALLYAYPLNKITQTMSVCTHLVITFERYLAVCHPFRASQICTVRFSLSSLAAVTVYSALFHLPRFWEYSTEPAAWSPSEMVPRFHWRTRYPLYTKLYTGCLDLLLNFVLPFVFLVAFNSKIVLTLKRANRNRRRYVLNGPTDNGSLTTMGKKRSVVVDHSPIICPDTGEGEGPPAASVSCLSMDTTTSNQRHRQLSSSDPRRTSSSYRFRRIPSISSWTDKNAINNNDNNNNSFEQHRKHGGVEEEDSRGARNEIAEGQDRVGDDERGFENSRRKQSKCSRRFPLNHQQRSGSNLSDNISLMRSTNRSSSFRWTTTTSKRRKSADLKQRRTSQMMTLIILTFLCFHVLALALAFKDSYTSGLNNSAVNFIIYYRYSGVYRMELAKACQGLLTVDNFLSINRQQPECLRKFVCCFWPIANHRREAKPEPEEQQEDY